MFDPESPFYIKPRLDREFLAWLWKFRGACNQTNVNRGLPVLSSLNAASLELFDELEKLDDVEFNYEKKGVVQIFKTRNALDKGIREARRLQQYGVESRVLENKDMPPYSGELRTAGAGGIFFPRDAQLIPDRFVHQLARYIEKAGVRVVTSAEAIGFAVCGRKVTTVKTTRGDLDAEDVILACGSWSTWLARELGIQLRMEPAKGYSVTFRRPPSCPDLPFMMAETKVVLTPMDDMLRIAGTLELAGFDMSINNRRLQAILKSIRDYFPDFDIDSLETIEIWRGLRPCSPDGLPYIGRPRRYDNVIIATGHGMKGISLAPVTGQIVSQLAAHKQPRVDMAALSIERFDHR
jgi:D-amino-acid dehydrogenase